MNNSFTITIYILGANDVIRPMEIDLLALERAVSDSPMELRNATRVTLFAQQIESKFPKSQAGQVATDIAYILSRISVLSSNSASTGIVLRVPGIIDSGTIAQTITQHYPYDVALSFAGEDRSYADALAEVLRNRGLNVFYDKYEKSTLWGKNLYTYLSDIYQEKARFCVMFLSKHYATKLWTNHEREAAQARAFRENEDYILPVRLDDTLIPGIPPTVAYLSWPPETAETIADAILEKLGKRPLDAQEIFDRIGTITDRMVLILGRFTPERKAVLDAIREALPSYNYSPILFDFDIPPGRSITDVTVMFAQMSRFIIADLTDPKNIPHEIATIVPRYVVPVQPILATDNRREYSMFQDLQQRYHWVLPIFRYQDIPHLLASLKKYIIDPAEQKAKELAQQ